MVYYLCPPEADIYMAKGIYLDNAAATPMDPRVVRVVAQASKIVGNPSSFNDAGRQAEKVLAVARAQVAQFLHAHESEVIFCSSGSEANTLAIGGVTEVLRKGHIVTTAIEHDSVLQSAKKLTRRGWRVSYVPVNAQGQVRPEDVLKLINKKTALVSVMYANNEIGTIEPVAKIGRMITAWRRAHNSQYPLFHIDACQAAGYLDMDVQRLGADLLTFNGSKIYGPRGSAVLYVRRGIELASQVLGGDQERGRRAGTENIPAAVGLAKAVSLIKPKDSVKIAKLRDYFISKLSTVVPEARVNGPLGNDRLANNINISIPGTDSENLLLELDRDGISAGSGSACTAHSVEPSHVLKAIGTPKKYLNGVLRFSLSRLNTQKEIDTLLKVLPIVVQRVRTRNAQ